MLRIISTGLKFTVLTTTSCRFCDRLPMVPSSPLQRTTARSFVHTLPTSPMLINIFTILVNHDNYCVKTWNVNVSLCVFIHRRFAGKYEPRLGTFSQHVYAIPQLRGVQIEIRQFHVVRWNVVSRISKNRGCGYPTRYVYAVFTHRFRYIIT